MVTKLGKDLQRVVKTASLTRKDSVWVGDRSIKERAGDAWSEREHFVVTIIAVFKYLKDAQVFLGAKTVQ